MKEYEKVCFRNYYLFPYIEEILKRDEQRFRNNESYYARLDEKI